MARLIASLATTIHTARTELALSLAGPGRRGFSDRPLRHATWSN
jgi:hypothetical protein